MSGRLVSAVFDSALPAWLKPYAAVCASFALDDGTRVFPTVQRVAKMVGRCERATQTALQELRRRGVLIVEAGPGRHQATRYRFNVAALPHRHDGSQLDLFAADRVSGFPQFPQASTRSGLHPKGEVDRTRSVMDPLFDPHLSRVRAKTGT